MLLFYLVLVWRFNKASWKSKLAGEMLLLGVVIFVFSTWGEIFTALSAYDWNDVLFAPIIEEGCKFFAMFIVFKKQSFPKSESFRSLIYIPVLLGLGFAVSENFARIFFENMVFLQVLIRCFSVYLMHIFTPSLSGYGLSRFMNYKKSGSMVFYLVLTVFVHMFFNGYIAPLLERAF